MPAGLAVGDLAGVPLVTTPIGTSSRALVERTLAAAAVAPVVAVETGQREALLPLVLAGAGTALLPRPLAEEAGRRGAVVADLRPPLRRSVGLVYRRAQLSPAARAFVELARRQRAAGSSTAKVASSRASQSTGAGVDCPRLSVKADDEVIVAAAGSCGDDEGEVHRSALGHQQQAGPVVEAGIEGRLDDDPLGLMGRRPVEDGRPFLGHVVDLVVAP